MNPSSYVLSQKVDYDCPFCDKTHTLQVRTRLSTALIKSESVEYEQTYFYCPIEDEEFIPSKIMDENLLKARDSYRQNRGLLTSNQLKEIRKNYKLTQKDFSNLLGWGDVTLQRYETKLIQDETYDNCIRIVAENPTYALELLDKHKSAFCNDKYIEIREFIKKTIKEKGNSYLKMQEIKNCYIDFELESDFNGFKKLNLEKINKLLGYFAQFIEPLYKVKMMKLLWYSDAIHFKRYGTSMTGLVYKHLPMGAVPIGYNEILSLPSIEVEEHYINDYIAYRIFPKDDISISAFSFEELDILQLVTNFFKDMKTESVVSYMHDEIAYLETDLDQIIPYSLAQKLRDL